MGKSRKDKLDHFYRLYSGSVLDVGVADETQTISGRGPALNLFLKTFRYHPEKYTGLGIQDLSGMNQLYPGKHFVQYSGGQFPFNDNEFSWVFSNAVIEHVGDEKSQVQFVNEMIRVGRKVFFTTPNKYFPVESHTNVLFLHWNNSLFYAWCKQHKPWCTKDSVYLFSYRQLELIMKQVNTNAYQIFKNRLFGMTMTFTVVCT
ncbi:MAG: class I SAM-dependent methyltransferase [Clostridiales bacterium]|nr:class I SAM-dependent methyltransferase [Clostridiales bacterium]